ncbi:MAG: hypothetical protein M3O78_02620, partial [Chloroflexota bacterium]|nr:hypothetical protein [Chloroflexota bacterium]
MNRRGAQGSPEGHGRLRITVASALVVLVFGLVVWGCESTLPRSAPLTAEQRQAATQELLSGIQISANVSSSSLAASKALVDYMAQNDVRLVLVRIVDDLDLKVQIKTNHAVALSEPPSFCLIGPFSAPDDAGYSSPCWGMPDAGEVLAAQLPTDGAGHTMFPAGPAIALTATMQRGGLRCDYPPGRWLLVVNVDPLLDGTATGVHELPGIGFDVPWSIGDLLPFLPVKTVAYCGSANVVYNVVYKEQGEPDI